MSKSLEFCRTTASDPERSTFADRDWNNANEQINTEDLFDRCLSGLRNYWIKGVDDKGDEIQIHIELVFDPDADFDYFTSETCIKNGDWIFTSEMIYKCIGKVIDAETYNKNLRSPKTGDTVRYTIGNFVSLHECDKRFALDDNPWSYVRTTVLLPLKVEIKE